MFSHSLVVFIEGQGHSDRNEMTNVSDTYHQAKFESN